MAQNFSASSQASLLRRILHRVAFIFLLIFSFLLIFLGKPDNIIIQNTSEFLIQITGKTVTIVSKPFIYIRDSFETLKNLFGVENENRVLRHTIELLNSRVNELKNLESVYSCSFTFNFQQLFSEPETGYHLIILRYTLPEPG